MMLHISDINHDPRDDESWLPHNLEAEQALLGAIFLDNRAFERVAEIVAPIHFFDPTHRQVFELIGERIAAGRLASPTTLKAEFQDAALHHSGLSVIQYLGQLVARASTISGAKDYALTIRELAARRELVHIGDEISRGAREAGAEDASAGIIEEAEGKLFEIAEKAVGATGGTVSFAEAAGKAVDRIQAAYKRGGGLNGLSTGFVDLDHKLGGLQRSDLIILAARPSMGKTALATNVAWNIARSTMVDDCGVERSAPVGFFSLEMAAAQLATRLISSETEIPSSRLIRGTLTSKEAEDVIRKTGEIHRTPFYIDDRGGITIAQLAARARRMKRRHGIELLIVDYLQLLSGSKKERVQELTQITTGLKALAKELDIPIIALSQLSRANEKREDKRPQLSDLRESGSIEQDADVVIFVYREEYYIEREKPDPGDAQKFGDWQRKMQAAHGKAEAIVGKHRHGSVGIVDMAFEGDFTRFSDLARGAES